MLYKYNKLIRDNNVKIMEDKGCKVTYEILDDKRYGEELELRLYVDKIKKCSIIFV